MNHSYEENAKIFKAFCDGNRLKVLELLQSGEKCACVLLDKLNISQSTLSHHMKILCDSGIVTGRREGKWTHYSICTEGSQKALSLLEDLTKLSCGTEACEKEERCAEKSAGEVEKE